MYYCLYRFSHIIITNLKATVDHVILVFSKDALNAVLSKPPVNVNRLELGKAEWTDPKLASMF